jgi:hypothetical protein
MCKLAHVITALLIAVAAALSSGTALAQNNRSFVSGQGSDGNPCTLAAPCRSFAQALTQTASGGEIVPLDSAGYGPMVITQSIAITVPNGIYAGVTAPSGQDVITISAAGGNVTLRGLTIEGFGVAYRGIYATAFGTLNITDCVVKDFTNSPIFVAPATDTANLTITDSLVLHGTFSGIALLPTGAASLVFAIRGSTSQGNGNGLVLDASGTSQNAIGSIIDSHFDMNGLNGLLLTSHGAPTNAHVTIKNSTANHNCFLCAGLTNEGATVYIDASEFAFNYYGMFIGLTNSLTYSYGNNDLSGNTIPVNGGPVTSASLQ